MTDSPSPSPSPSRHPAGQPADDSLAASRQGGKRRRRRLFLALALATLLVAGALSGCSAITAGKVLRDSLRPSSELRPLVEESEVAIPGVHGATRAVLIRPVGATGPLPAFVLCPGAVEAGPAEPRMRALARALALHGATVLAPELRSLERFRIDTRDLDRLVEAGLWLADDGDLTEDGRIGFLGICIGGSYGLVAAGDPRLADRVSGVLAMGAYDDLNRLLHRWMVEPVDAPELFDPLTEGRRRVLLGNLDRLVEPGDVDLVAAGIWDLIAGDADPTEPQPAGSRARRVLAAARSEEPLVGPEARFLVAPLDDEMRALSPSAVAANPGATVYVLHGTTDPVVPYSEGLALEHTLDERGVDVCFHGTDLFRHVDALEAPSFWDAWSLARFLGAFLDDAGM